MVISPFLNGLARGSERRFWDKPAFCAGSARRFIRFARFWRCQRGVRGSARHGCDGHGWLRSQVL